MPSTRSLSERSRRARALRHIPGAAPRGGADHDAEDTRRSADERGAATAEFVMVSALLVLLTMLILQLAFLVHVRNTLIDAASTGARLGVLHDRTPQDGAQRTAELISGSITEAHAEDISYEYVPAGEGRSLRITVRTQVPLLGPYLGAGALEVSGNAYEFD
ncbi:TadE/TadG family type IV pilus assembly protein [Nesterenkonia lacusekhoensis]|uniref:Flp pilus assembly protein TadG n=1 Tax=Nesterenkonia lacusekhoensis TaxID=150832 RepID=A0ABS4T1Z3_9MICC|nr:TadE/TadG family type IV pilus assembly protein [Nesterenkonia lacusekhoensis]MBP2318467.1 Flp pilus assembly protein TadG [Nesterenkonia lacusekhoensis]